MLDKYDATVTGAYRKQYTFRHPEGLYPFCKNHVGTATENTAATDIHLEGNPLRSSTMKLDFRRRIAGKWRGDIKSLFL